MINLRLPWPPSVNHYYTIARGRKILSKRGRQYKKDVAFSGAVNFSSLNLIAADARLEVNIDVYPPDKRKRDLDNLLKPVLDALFPDDSRIDILRIRRRQKADGGYLRVHISEIE